MNPTTNNPMGVRLFPFYEPLPRFTKSQSPVPDQETVEQYLARGGVIQYIPRGYRTEGTRPLSKSMRSLLEHLR